MKPSFGEGRDALAFCIPEEDKTVVVPLIPVTGGEATNGALTGRTRRSRGAWRVGHIEAEEAVREWTSSMPLLFSQELGTSRVS
jgi:hypothetical protein